MTTDLPNPQNPEIKLRLLKPVSAISSEKLLEAGGQFLAVSENETISSLSKVPYTCVSFSWGTEKIQSPLDAEILISKRALPVLETVVNTMAASAADLNFTQPVSIWMDTFSVPAESKSRDACLRAMGTVYANAEQVIAVLSKNASSLLNQIRNGEPVDYDTLLKLENEDWVTRAWTYQEIVNSKTIYFIAEGETGVPVRGDLFFDAIAKSIEPFSIEKGLDSFSMQEKYPALISFEAVVLDWRIADYQERSAYQVMTNMCYRKTDQPDGIIYSIIGCIAGSEPGNESSSSISPTEQFKQTCERKGDFSFMYTKGPRSTAPGKGWRPEGDDLRPVHPWLYCWGEGQAGVLHDTHLELKNVRLLKPGPVSGTSIGALKSIIKPGSAATAADYLSYILQCLRKTGFDGSCDYIEMEEGYFFPQEPVTDLTAVQAVVATGVTWTFGAPAFLVKSNGTDKYIYYKPGVFVGVPGKSELSVSVV